ncbi:efflux RND transporter permease subunit [Hyphomicrobiales bacterium 4NK60-0047b]
MIAFFARHPVAANLILLAVAYLGLTALIDMERESFPSFSSGKVAVSISYPGASAVDVDEQVCVKLNDELGSIDDLDELECQSIDGRASATLTMKDEGDIGQFYNDVSSAVSGINDLPDEAEAAQVSIANRTETIAFLAVSGLDNPHVLVRYTDDLANKLQALSMVATANISGISDSQFLISFNPEALRLYKVSASDVANALSSRSLQLPLGEVSTKAREIVIRYSDARRSRIELEDLIILQNKSGGFVRLSDLATVALVESTPEQRAFINGKRAAIINISKTATDDAINAFAQVKALIAAEKAKYPDPFEINIIADVTEPVSKQLSIVMNNAVQSIILVLFVMTLFLSFKEAMWISLALPFSFLACVFMMSILGVTINMITLLGLIMSIGLIMDDSIIIADNIAKWRSKTSSNLEAAVKGAREVMGGVVSSFLTTASVFGPLMILSGEIGKVLQFIPVVLLITLAASLIEAFFILPNHLSHVHGSLDENAKRFFPRQLDLLKEKIVMPTTAFLVRWRYATVGTVIATLIVFIGLITSGRVNVIGITPSEENTIEARIALSSGMPLAQTEKVATQLLTALEKVNKAHSPNTVGSQPLVVQALVTHASNSDIKDNGPNTFTITVDLLSSELRNIKADDVLQHWKEAAGPITDLVQSNFTQVRHGPGGKDLNIQLYSRNLVELEGAASDLLARLKVHPDVVVAYRDFYSGRPTIELKLNEYAYTIGVTPQILSNQLRSAFSGVETDSFKLGLSDREVRVEISDAVPSLTALEDYPISLSDGKTISLSTIADINLTNSYGQITRKDGRAMARVLGSINWEKTTSGEISQFATRVV